MSRMNQIQAIEALSLFSKSPRKVKRPKKRKSISPARHTSKVQRKHKSSDRKDTKSPREGGTARKISKQRKSLSPKALIRPKKEKNRTKKIPGNKEDLCNVCLRPGGACTGAKLRECRAKSRSLKHDTFVALKRNAC